MPKLLSERVVREFHEAMVLREKTDYHGSFSEAGARKTMSAAKEFLTKSREITVSGDAKIPDAQDCVSRATHHGFRSLDIS